jgi:hypothetical protein
MQAKWYVDVRDRRLVSAAEDGDLRPPQVAA